MRKTSQDVANPIFFLCNCVHRAFGKINIIVNNAGFTFDAMLHKTTDKQFQLMLEVHNAAPFRIIRAAAKYMRVKDGEPRSIVNVSEQAELGAVLQKIFKKNDC